MADTRPGIPGLQAGEDVNYLEVPDAQLGIIPKRSKALADRARAAAAELGERREPTDEELRELRRKHSWPIGEFIYFAVACAVLARFGGGEAL